ncbi:hypothetical protein C8R45DRAFT_1006527 [Mycena sanguinolenta]|nr:hypothetical protein C8R45DRAFT_1006527 [Mycena sanguinolenta]
MRPWDSDEAPPALWSAFFVPVACAFQILLCIGEHTRCHRCLHRTVARGVNCFIWLRTRFFRSRHAAADNSFPTAGKHLKLSINTHIIVHS